MIFYDNQSTMKIAKNYVFHVHTKQIEAHYHYICENLETEKVELVHVPSWNQLVDIMTKPLGGLNFEKFRNDLGICNISETKQKEKMALWSFCWNKEGVLKLEHCLIKCQS